MVVEYIVPAAILVSSVAMLYSSYRLLSYNNSKYSIISTGTSYKSQVKELELRREIIKTAILNIYKQYEEGKLDESLKTSLLERFESELDEIESKLASLREYAELESLREEYEKLVREYEKRRVELENRISELERKLKPPKEEKKVKKEDVKEEKRRKSDEDVLDEILREVSKIIEEYGVD
ncbi:MAG TPA: hypothetical protein EYH44_04260 [Thermoprotei archaeon]|nr:hypothetical protein [Thermoprotei archaeon]